MLNDLFRLYLPLAVALLLVIYVLSKRKAREARRAREAAEQRREMKRRLRELDSRYDGETADFEEYSKRLECQRQLVERYDREHKGDQR